MSLPICQWIDIWGGNVQSHKRQWCVGTCQFFTATYGNLRFYALTPDLAVANVDHEGDGAKCAVAVEHGMDYATSLTAGQTVSEASPTVVLNDLGRHCTKLIFELMPKAGNIRSVDIASAGLTNMTRAPVSAILNTALPIMGVSKSEELTIEGSEFPYRMTI